MRRADFYIEYYETVDEIIDEYLTLHNLPSYVGTVLFDHSYSLKEWYNRCRSEGLDKANARSVIRKSIIPKSDIFRDYITPEEILPLHHILGHLGDRLAIYVYNTRQLHYLRPFIEAVNRPSVLLCETSVNLDLELPEYVEAIDLDYLIVDKIIVSNDSLHDKLKKHYILLHSVLSELSPEGVVLLEGCHFQEQMIGEIAISLGFPSILFQQGWPSLMHTMFRRFPYTHFLTWGENFNNLWSRYNPRPFYRAVGYPYSVKKKRGHSISFFLQAPLFISDSGYYSLLIDLIVETATAYSDRAILVREHPEYRMEPSMKARLLAIHNVRLATEWSLEDVFADSIIVVSHFSSSLMEGIIHGCIPLVFDPTTNSKYLPDVETLRLGALSNNVSQFFSKLEHILLHYQSYFKNICTAMNKWFHAIDRDAVANQVKTVNAIAPIKALSRNIKKLNLGCGRNLMSGWLNVDLYSVSPQVLVMDASRSYPFPDESFDYIFSEHMFEHLDINEQQIMLSECFRVLRYGGVLRIAMPDFNFLVDLVNNPDSEVNRRYLAWSYATYIQGKISIDSNDYPVYVVNNFMQGWGHKFIHNPASLKNLAVKAGFSDITHTVPGDSSFPDLCQLERHDQEIPRWANTLETFVMEMKKLKSNTYI